MVSSPVPKASHKKDYGRVGSVEMIFFSIKVSDALTSVCYWILILFVRYYSLGLIILSQFINTHARNSFICSSSWKSRMTSRVGMKPNWKKTKLTSPPTTGPVK